MNELTKSIKHYPKPEYCKCNAGHTLVEIYNEKRNVFEWDCPICIRKMSDYYGKCKNCGIQMHFTDPDKWVLDAFGFKPNNKIPKYCRKCYNPDLGIDKRDKK